MELLDRQFQWDLLNRLQEIYPNAADPANEFEDLDDRQFIYNLAYLGEHGLIDVEWQKGYREHIPNRVRINAKGIDFIINDGGLSAILGVIVVKLHTETVKDLLIRRIEEEDADETVKGNLIKKLREAPAEAMGQLASQALQSGVANLPDIISWLGKFLGP